MATPSHSQAVKSLNTYADDSPNKDEASRGRNRKRKRFVFKNFSQRIEEIDVGEKVFRSLHHVKAEPSQGSSFLRDALIEWRELNTAEDFITFYEEMMPWVQTLPQVLLHKDVIMSKLISRLQFKARLSLEPILRLIADLSRDLLGDFLPFLQRIIVALVDLLENGADREPEVIEQIFTSWSYIMMYLKKYLIQDINNLLKTTTHLRYYPKDYVQEFMAESVAFLLRNAPDKQLTQGVMEIIDEVVGGPSDERKSGASAFLWHVMRGASSKFHSRADRVLRLMTSECIIGSERGSVGVVEVIAATFQRACEDLHPKELKLIWSCVFDEISSSIESGTSLRLSNLLSVVVYTIRFRNGCIISASERMIYVMALLVHKFVAPVSLKTQKDNYEVVDKVLELMLCLLDGFVSSGDVSAIASLPSQWAPIFELRNESLLTFIGELLRKDPCVSDAFSIHILSALTFMVEASPSPDVIFLVMKFFEKMESISNCSVGVQKEKMARLCSFLQESVTAAINDIGCKTMHFDESKLAELWAILSCYPHFSAVSASPSLIMDLVHALDQLPLTEEENVAGVPSCTWQSVVGAALTSYLKLHLGQKFVLAEETKTFLYFALKYKSSSKVLFAVADFLDFVYGSPFEVDTSCRTFHPQLNVERATSAIHLFSDNLCHPDNVLRLSTLRILFHYELIDRVRQASDQTAEKKNTEAQMSCNAVTSGSNVIQLLLSIEATALSISTSRKIIVVISQIQMGISAARFAEVYVPLILNGIISIFLKRFDQLWGPALECLSLLIEKYPSVAWGRFNSYLEACQLKFLTCGSEFGKVNAEHSSKQSDLVKCFNAFATPLSDSTPCMTVLSLLLRSLQKVSNIVESRSRQLLPLFFEFLGYTDDLTRDYNVASFKTHSCKGKEWRAVLKEWLNLLKVMRNPKSLYQSEILKEILMNRLLHENDADIQMKVLECLLNWKDDFLLPYGQHLKNIIISKSLREELAAWTLSKESQHIQELHRRYLIPIVIRLLVPKVRNLKTLASRKNASIHHRKAILCFLAQLDISELQLFFFLLIKPLQPLSSGNEDFSNWFWSSCVNSQEEFDTSTVVNYFTVDKIKEISWKKRYGFLHVLEDILKSMDEMHLRPFLNLFMGLVVRILEGCTMGIQEARNKETTGVLNPCTGHVDIDKTDCANSFIGASIKKLKDLRSSGLKIIYLVLNKYEDHYFGCAFWDVFFTSVKDLVAGFQQEGSSSKTPSSLFLCFLAMSKSHSLVLLLQREKDLVPNIFKMLNVRKTSNAIKNNVFSFVENLLNLGTQKDLAVSNILLPNLEDLISSLHSFYKRRKAKNRNSVKWLGKRQLKIFKLLASYISESVAAARFVDIMLPFIGNRALNSDDCLECLDVIQGIVPILGTGSTKNILNAVAPLLISVGVEIRLSICVLLERLAVNDPSVCFLAKLVRELNAMSLLEIGEFDYDLRLSAYEKVDHELFCTMREDHALVILSHSVYDMSSEELILRQSAHRLFLSFIHFCALVLESKVENSQGMSEAMVSFEPDPCWTKECVERIIETFFIKHMGEAMRKGLSVQTEWMVLLQEMVLRLPQIPALNSVKHLCSKDAEVDFFNNIIHLQIHRRARALARFRKTIAAGNFSETITNTVFIPLFFKMLFDVQDGKGEHLRNACVEALAAISGNMEWYSYHSFLLSCFDKLTSRHDKWKVLLRLICSILDQFHFKEICMNQKSDDAVSEVPKSSATLPDCLSEIQDCLQKTVLPKIQKLLDDDSERVDVVVNLAALKLLKLLPMDTMESQLSSIIHRICNSLKSRMESIRDEARHALAACLKELGLEYLQFIVKVLRATLKRGYELHVLGFTLNFILSKALNAHLTGKLDYCLDELLSVVENDILGDVGEEKDVDKIASKMKETRKPKSFQTLELIAQNITFKTHALKLLSPVKSHLQKHLSPKLKEKLQTMLSRIAVGIECNNSVDQTDLFVFVYGLIEDGIKEETLHGKDSSTAKSSKQCIDGEANKTQASPWIASYQSQSSHLITVFALGVLSNRLCHKNLDKKDNQFLSMLDPFVKLLGDCLSSKYEDILSVALTCLAVLLKLPLPSRDIQSSNIKSLLLDIAQKSGSTSSPLVDSCLRLLTVLLRVKKITLSSDQLHMLIQFPLFVDLERNPSFVALSLLEAIVRRKFIVSEIFDIVTRVAEMMVTSQDELIRKKCSKILFLFLHDGYGISSNRKQQHLDFLLANLRYEHSTGREAVLEILYAIIVKWKQETIEEQAKTLFLHLVLCLANDQDNKVRSMVAEVIKVLIKRICKNEENRKKAVPISKTNPILESILQISLSWYMGDKRNLLSAAAQVLGLLAEVLNGELKEHMNNVWPVMKNVLKSCLIVFRTEQPKFSNEATVQFWRETYYSLVLLEKVLKQFPELHICKELVEENFKQLQFDTDIEEVWEAVCDFLLYPHQWIRNISNRLVASYFQQARDKTPLELHTILLMKPSRIFSLAVSFCCQLRSQLTEDAACNLLNENLAIAILRLHSVVEETKGIDVKEFWSALEVHEQGHFVKAFQLLGSRKGKVMLACLSDVIDEKNQNFVEGLQSFLVTPLINRMGKLALQGDVQSKIVFKCFEKISSKISKEGTQNYAVDLLYPLYKVCEGSAGKVFGDDVKQLAEEVRGKIQETIGGENFVKSYNEIRKKIKAKRDKRRQKEKLLPAINPERHAKRKLKIAAKHRAHKKRKLMVMKKMVWNV